MKISVVGLDLAKNVFPVHGVDERGDLVLRKQLRRHQVLAFFVRQERCLIGMEACSGAHYWARELRALGHEVRLMAPQFVKPYVKANKTDAADAEAICEAVNRPHMRFVPIKSEEQQAVLALHRSRSALVKARTALINQIRGLLTEYGIVLAVGTRQVRMGVPALLEDGERNLPPLFRQLLWRLHQHLNELDGHVAALDRDIEAWHQCNEDSRRIAQVPGIGVLTATALVASIGDAKSFKNGRQLAAWLGLVPRQHSSGGKVRLQGISKRGDVYLRTLMIHGARAAERTAKPDRSATDAWAAVMAKRRPKNVVLVARANKHARIVWALLAHRRDYQAAHRPLRAA
jgi:transposase